MSNHTVLLALGSFTALNVGAALFNLYAFVRNRRRWRRLRARERRLDPDAITAAVGGFARLARE